MQLKRLEAYGFKSFADKIEIEFNNGVTAIVGPNGSGKSNITDAIRWVLGEQNVRALRGMKAEDIIFTGSTERRALGVAEVSLTLLNEGDMAVDFQEVVITRRLFRSGERAFFINKAPCRLKDIYALIADTGLGHDGLSVIGQNKIDEILNSRPEERRLFFEETAGITKYRDRKRESLRKLEDTEKNLTRVADLQQEVESRLGPLEEEAARTRQYNAWQEEYRQVKVTELFRQQERFRQEEAEGQETIRQRQEEEAEARAQLGAREAEGETLATAIVKLEQDLQACAGEREAIRSRKEKAENEIRVLEVHRQQHDENQRRLKEQLDSLRQQQAAAEKERTEYAKAEAACLEEKAAADQKLQEEKEKARGLAEQVRAQKENTQALRQSFSEAQRAAVTKKGELDLLDQGMANDSTNREEEAARIQTLEKELTQNQKKLAELEAQAQAQAQTHAALETARQDAETRQRKLRDSMRARQQTLRMGQQFIDQAGAKLATLERMQKDYEGFGKAAKMVLTAREGWRKGVAGAVAELLEIPAKYLTAAEVALGAAQQNIVTEDAETARQAIAYLKRARAGRVTFLPLDTLTPRSAPEEKVRRQAGVIGYMSEVVTAAEKFRKVVEFLLGRTLLVDTMDHALQVAKQQGYRLRIVTLEGELLSPGGSITGGSLQSRESGFLNRGGEIETLRQSLTKRQTEQEKEQAAYDAAVKEAAASEQQAAEAKEKLDDLRVTEAETGTNRKLLADRVAADDVQLDAMKALAARREESFARAQGKRVQVVRELREAENRQTQLAREVREAEENLADLEDDADSQGKLINQRELAAAELGNRATTSRTMVLTKDRELSRLTEEITKNRQEAEQLESGLAEGAERIGAFRQEAAALEAEYAAKDKEHQAIYAARMEKVAAREENEGAVRLARQAVARVQEQLHQLELAQSKRRFQTEQCEAMLKDEYQLSPAEAAALALDIPERRLKEERRSLEERIAALGAVNPGAIDEYEKLSQRYEFMQNQMKDLEKARADLDRIIREMDATMTRQFKEAFAQIQKHFHEIFTALFGGGKAELFLTDEKNVLESGVEIVVQVPDKKQQNLSALSGGERALTVIALLFAFLKVRPAPFSVLDEIDAPLDEANIARFGRFLQEFSQETQFVIVTHRKGTMAAADTMYGVTLEDAGVSKILSVKLEDISA
ncbi:MAG: chromosome segregation protein SMC [Schwartzia sp.]|nr:chromosome segregation protein SMC [Schwartzia sp. (in: firmicutes)]